MRIFLRGISAPLGADLSRISPRSLREGACRCAWITAEEATGKQTTMVEVCSAWNRATGVRVTWTGLRAFLTCRAVLRVITPVIERNNGGLTMRYSGRDQQTGGRRVAASTAQWLVDGLVPAWCRRAWAWARWSVAVAGLPVSPERRERRGSSSASPAASACPGPDGGAAGRGLSGVFRRPGLKMRRRADGGPASAADPGKGTGRREPGRVRVRSLAARGLAAALSANITETPATFVISVGRRR